MATSDRVFVAGAHELSLREAPDTSTMQLHAEAARGALDDAGLSKDDVDGYLTAGIPEYEYALPGLIMTDFLGLDVTFFDTTDTGGGSYVTHVGHAADAIRNGRCDVALVTFAGRPRSRDQATGTGTRELRTYQDSFEKVYGLPMATLYAMAAHRHMHEYGTTPEQLAAVRAAASLHASHNEHARYRDRVTVEEVLESRVIAEPLHLLDCCVITDGGGACVLVSESVGDHLDRDCVEVLGSGEHTVHQDGGRVDLTRTGAEVSGAAAFAEAGVNPDDVDYASIYDSFTITVIQTLEDLGFCAKGDGGAFVEGGTLEAPDGNLPVNTDGGGLCSNHPNRGGMIRLVEAVRQLRGEATPAVQVPDADIALIHGLGGPFGKRNSSATVILGGPNR